MAPVSWRQSQLHTRCGVPIDERRPSAVGVDGLLMLLADRKDPPLRSDLGDDRWPSSPRAAGGLSLTATRGLSRWTTVDGPEAAPKALPRGDSWTSRACALASAATCAWRAVSACLRASTLAAASARRDAASARNSAMVASAACFAAATSAACKQPTFADRRTCGTREIRQHQLGDGQNSCTQQTSLDVTR